MVRRRPNKWKQLGLESPEVPGRTGHLGGSGRWVSILENGPHLWPLLQTQVRPEAPELSP